VSAAAATQPRERVKKFAVVSFHGQPRIEPVPASRRQLIGGNPPIAASVRGPCDDPWPYRDCSTADRSGRSPLREMAGHRSRGSRATRLLLRPRVWCSGVPSSTLRRLGRRNLEAGPDVSLLSGTGSVCAAPPAQRPNGNPIGS
jgi:hypothetical protein